MRTRIGAVAIALLVLGAPVALAHEGNPNYRSTVTGIAPAIEGVTVDVLNFDDRLLLQNTSGRPVVIEDYDGKPYARVLADRTVEVNTNSEAYYLNDDRFAQVKVPKGLGSQPEWKLVGRTGRFEWHDHRAHYMSPAVPAQVSDPERKTRIFDWKVPITVGGRSGAIAGTLDWVPLPSGSLPMGLIWGSAAAVILLALGVLALRRRRRPAKPDAGAPGTPSEAW